MSLPTDFGPDSGVYIVKPIVYGNIARYFGKKREEDGHTHQWTVYVKPYHNEDMSAYVKKVHFKLHESYANQNRIVVKPPYEISETGGTMEVGLDQGKGLVSESYDEIVFQDPTQLMHHLLTNTKQLTLGPWEHNTDFRR
ncbi:protein af-9 [Holotrichia oblita]|uniref:Protein af-9 n=1 Tax=Holotrichia oblita TaxID=644536 RepID=A0ACB9T3H8_HOLOL|nr:protein af-9 [Holotrichia oblita]